MKLKASQDLIHFNLAINDKQVKKIFKKKKKEWKCVISENIGCQLKGWKRKKPIKTSNKHNWVNLTVFNISRMAKNLISVRFKTTWWRYSEYYTVYNTNNKIFSSDVDIYNSIHRRRPP